MRLVDHPEVIEAWPEPTPAEPWRVLFSGCMAGWRCGVDGTDNAMGQALANLLALPTVRVIAFCPEEVALGTPRGTPDLHGGDGFDVLEGRARALDEHGHDLTAAMVAGAEAMVRKATTEQVRFAVLTDMSGACGTQVISDGCRFDEPRRYRRGVGVAAAALARAGVPLVSQRDYRTLARIRVRLGSTHPTGPDAVDHHESPWVLRNLPVPRRWPT